MSAIVAAAQRMERARLYTTTGIAGMMIAAGRAINAASNAAGAGRVVVGAGRIVGGQWWYVASDSVPTRYGGAWVWSTAAHDPRPCAWPRPFARSTP